MLFQIDQTPTTVKQKNTCTLTQFLILVEAVSIVSYKSGIRGYELQFTKKWVMDQLFVTRYHATKMLDNAVKLGLLHKRSNQYSVNVESALYIALQSISVGY